jgi:hypothetical protein
MVNAGFCRANPHSKQDCTFGHSSKGEYVFYERASGREGAHSGVGKNMVSDPPVSHTRKEQRHKFRPDSRKIFSAVHN